MDPSARLGVDRVARWIRAALSAGRAVVAGLDSHRIADASLVLNFVFTPNLNYREITGLLHVSFLGETVAVAEGIPNPWMLIGQLSLLLFVIFVADAAITVWQRGDRRQARIRRPSNASRSVVQRMRRVSAPEPNSKSLTSPPDVTPNWRCG